MKFHRSAVRAKNRTSDRASSFPLSPLFWCIAGYFTVLSLFGAAEVHWGLRAFAICIASCVFAPAAIWHGGLKAWGSAPLAARYGLCLFTIFCLLQLVPLPPELWTNLPGHGDRLLVLEQNGMAASWMPLSQTPLASFYGTLLQIAAVVAVAALMSLREREFTFIAVLLAGFVALGILIGSMQVATAGRTFRFYDETDAGALVGLYANKNHMALAIVCSIAIANFLSRTVKFNKSLARSGFLGYWIFAALTLLMTNSRAGLILGAMMSLAIIFWSMTGSIAAYKKMGVIGGFALLIAVAITLPLPQEAVARFGDVASDIRWPMLQHSLVVWKDYWLLGSGLGSFADVFMTYETTDWLFPTYVNNVHNDYVQLGIETGVVGLFSSALLGVGLVVAAFRAYRSGDERARALALMGFAISMAFALHSIADYPLRRPAALAIFIFAIAAVFRGGHSHGQRGTSASIDGHTAR